MAGWAVYVQPMKGCPDGVRVICPQAEWERLDAARPGCFTLIEGNLANEGAAERLARGRAGEVKVRVGRPKIKRHSAELSKIPDMISPPAAIE